jgi:hypothetical protein
MKLSIEINLATPAQLAVVCLDDRPIGFLQHINVTLDAKEPRAAVKLVFLKGRHELTGLGSLQERIEQVLDAAKCTGVHDIKLEER